MDIKNFTEKFFEKYGNRNNKPVLFFSPGRVNLIGEHTDYNGGFVFPCALNYGTYLLIRKIKGKILKFSTLNFNDDAETEIKGLIHNTGKKWINYPLGVINEFLKKEYKDYQDLNCFIMVMFQMEQVSPLQLPLKWLLLLLSMNCSMQV